MAPKIPNQKSKYAALAKRLAKYVLMVENIYDAHNLEASQIAISTGHDGSTPFSFSDYPLTKKRTQDLIDSWRKEMAVVIYSGTSAEWRESNLVQDLLADKVISYYWGKEHGKRKRKYYETNSEALQAFQRRRDKGMNLSDKIWLQGEQYRTELEDAISCGIQKGMSAVTLSKRVSKYLNDFPQLQKDYKEKYGKATDAINCEYRSMRLARTEINMAYRSAEQHRWQQMDFIVGFEVKKSKVHDERMPHGDICDILSEKKYPKDFKFVGWHPNCMCYVIPIMKTEDEFFEDDEDAPSVNAVREYPKEMRDYIEANKDRIERAQERGTLPYWLRDNPSLTSPKKSVWEIARERHANRDDAAIQQAWNERKARNLSIRTGNNVLNVYNGRGYGELGGDLEMRRKRLEKALSLNDTAAIQSETKALAAEMARKRKLTMKTADNVLNVAKDYHEVTTSPLIDAKKTTDYAHIRRQTIDLAKEISSIKKDDAYLSLLIPDVRMWKKQFSSAELHIIYDNVKRTLSTMPSELDALKTKLEFEINWMGTTGAARYPKTYKISQSAYQKKLAAVEHKIEVKKIADSVSEALNLSLISKSVPLKKLSDEMRALLTSPTASISEMSAKAKELDAKYVSLKKAHQKREAKKTGTQPVSNSNLPTPKTIEHLDDAIKEWEKTSRYKGTVAESHKAEIEEVMRRLFAQHDLGMNISDDVMGLVINSKFKNTFETGSSGGYLGSRSTSGKIDISHGRLGAAHKMFGLGKDLAKDQLERKEYEKYGHMLDHDIARSISNNSAMWYGNVEVRFKKDKVIATWTAGDSLGLSYQPSLVSDPRSCSFGRLSCAPTDKNTNVSNFTQFERKHISGYLELQFHGELTPDCVESLAYPYDLTDAKRSKHLDIAKKWKAIGARVFYIKNGQLEEL